MDRVLFIRPVAFRHIEIGRGRSGCVRVSDRI
jgi:hypothetical protein